MKKAPQAPKRFKSSYILFFTAKQDQIKKDLGPDASASDVAKKASEMWKAVAPDERIHWEEEAKKDKERYTYEKANYHGPWHVVKNPNRRTKKDPSAPKRNPSAFLLFCQERRPVIKAKHKGMKTTEITCILGDIWRNDLADSDKKVFVEREATGREKYKKDMAEWKKKQAQQKLIQETEQQNSLTINGLQGGLSQHFARAAWEQARLVEQTNNGHTPHLKALPSHGGPLSAQAERYSEYYSIPMDQYNDNYARTYASSGPYPRSNPQAYRTTVTSREDSGHVNKYGYIRSHEQPAMNVASPMRSYHPNENLDYYYKQQYPTHPHRANAEERRDKNPGRSIEVGDYEPFPI